MPEIKRVPQEGKMNLDFHERILPPGQYREALNVNVGRSETSEVGTVENLLGNAQIGETGIEDGVCIGSYRDNGNERIFFFVTNNDSFEESNSRPQSTQENPVPYDHGIFMFNQVSGQVIPLVVGAVLDFHINFPITGINLLEDLLFWTDDRNEPRKINIDRAINDAGYYTRDDDDVVNNALMAVAKTSPVEPPTIVSFDEGDEPISSTFLEDKLPRFSYRWQFEDGEYSVLAPFTPIIFQNPDAITIDARVVGSGQVFGFTNQVKAINMTVPIAPSSGIVSAELLYKDTSSNTVYIVDDQPISPTSEQATFSYRSQDPFRAIPGSQVERVSDAVPRRAKAQEVAGGRIVYGNFLHNYNLPSIDFEVRLGAGNTESGFVNHSLKSRRTYQVGVVLSDAFGRSTPVILSDSGNDTLFVGSQDLIDAGGPIQMEVNFPTPSQLEAGGQFTSYRIVVKQREQEYYQWFTSSGSRTGDNASKVPIDQTELVENDSVTRPSSRSVYRTGDSLEPVSINSSGVALIDGAVDTSTNQVYEVEPVTSELDIFFETSTGGYIDQLTSGFSPVSFYNCYLAALSGGGAIEANRIRMGFNEPFFDVGVRAHIVQEDFAGEERRSNALIHSSGFFNSRTGINQLNQFNESAGGLTVSLDPSDGSIQKLFAEDTQLIIWQEDKVSRSPVDKDFIYSAEGGAVPVTSNTQYLGTIAPYAGEYGISTDPQSFAVYGTRKYFTDRNRGVVLRLSNDGLTEINQSGMSDFFRDAMRDSNRIIGSFNEYQNTYNLTIVGNAYDRNEDTNKATAAEGYFTVGYEEDVNGWVSFKSFQQESGTTLNNRYYTFNGGLLWEHHREDVPRNNFYGEQYESYINFIFNDGPSSVKEFKTMGYEGEDGWQCRYIETDFDSIGDVPRENERYADATLNVEVDENDAPSNITFSGEATNIFPISGMEGPGDGSTRWIVRVSPISAQYVINSVDDVDLAIVVDGTENPVDTDATKRLEQGSVYFDVTRNLTNIDAGSSVSVVARLSGNGASLAFTVDLLIINIVNNIINTSLSAARVEFNQPGIVDVRTVDIIADPLYYLDAEDLSSTRNSFIQVGEDITFENDGPDNVAVRIPVQTPEDPVGSTSLTFSGISRLKPILRWVNDTTNLTGFESTSFVRTDDVATNIPFETNIPVSPRDENEERQGLYTAEILNESTDVIVGSPSADITNGSVLGATITVNNTDGEVSFVALSDISNEEMLTTTIALTATAEAAVLSIDDDTDINLSYLGTDGTDIERVVTHNFDYTLTQNPDWITEAAGVGETTLTISVPEIEGTGNAIENVVTLGVPFSRLTLDNVTFNINQRARYEYQEVTNDLLDDGTGSVIGNFDYPLTFTDPISITIDTDLFEAVLNASSESGDYNVAPIQVSAATGVTDIPAGEYTYTIDVEDNQFEVTFEVAETPEP